MIIRGLFFVLVLGIALLTAGNRPLSHDAQRSYSDSLWCAWEYEATAPFRAAQIDDYFQRLRSRKKFNGVVLVAEHGNILHSGAYGYAHFKRKDTLSIHTSFQLASVSKIFTATAIMMLHEEGKLCFDDKISTHLSKFPYQNMTIRHLLNHRSGMGRYMATAAAHWKTWRKPMYNDDVVDQYHRHNPMIFFTPGRGFNYCNTNYVFLASVVEAVSGMRFADFCRERIFEPLGMKHSLIYSRKFDPDIPNEATGYKVGWRGYYKADNDYIDGVVGDKGMYSSAYDLFLFDRALAEHRLLKPETLEQAYTPGTPHRRYNYGFGWRLKLGANEHKIPYHTGWWRGFRTCYIRDVEADRTLIVLSNLDFPGRNLNFWKTYEYIDDLQWQVPLP